MSNVELAGADNEKRPSTSVTVPVFVPCTRTAAPIMGSPFASVTVPETCDCAKAIPIYRNNPTNNIVSLLTISSLFKMVTIQR